MTQEEIKAKRQKIKDKLGKIDLKRKAQLAKLEVLKVICKHPNGYKTSCMGDIGYHCPDCGYSR